MIRAITEASATRKPTMPCTEALGRQQRDCPHHFVRANCVSKARRGKSGKFSDLLGACFGPWNEFALAQTVEGMLIPDFTRSFDGALDGRKIVIRAEIVAVDHGTILKVTARSCWSSTPGMGVRIASIC